MTPDIAPFDFATVTVRQATEANRQFIETVDGLVNLIGDGAWQDMTVDAFVALLGEPNFVAKLVRGQDLGLQLGQTVNISALPDQLQAKHRPRRRHGGRD